MYLWVALGIAALGLLAGFFLTKRRKSTVPLLRFSDLGTSSAYPQSILAVLTNYHRQYMEEFLAKPHPDLGRAGVVCPFIPTSIKKDCIYYGSISSTTVKDAAEQMMLLVDRFRALEPTAESKEEVYKTAILIFPEANRDSFVDDLQRHLKPRFVAKGLMIGAFHPSSQFSGLHNKQFFPRAAPFASVDIRMMVPEDLKFLSPSFVAARHSEQEAAGMLSAYIARFEPTSRVLSAAYAFLRDLSIGKSEPAPLKQD